LSVSFRTIKTILRFYHHYCNELAKDMLNVYKLETVNKDIRQKCPFYLRADKVAFKIHLKLINSKEKTGWNKLNIFDLICFYNYKNSIEINK
jgi:hypothetical protein